MKYLTEFDCTAHLAYMRLRQNNGRLWALRQVPLIRDMFLREGYMPEWVEAEYKEYLHAKAAIMPPRVTVTKKTVYSRDDIADMLGVSADQVEVRTVEGMGILRPTSFEIIVTEDVTEGENQKVTGHDQ